MNIWPLIVSLTICSLAVHADDGRQMLLDVPLEPAAPGKAAILDAKLFQHYEGLRHFAQGRQLELKERIPEALRAYHMALQFDGQAIDLIRHMLPLCGKMQQTASTLRLIRRSLGIDPQQPDLWMRLAQEQHELELYQDALLTVETALKSVKLDEYPAFKAELYVVQGSSLEGIKKYADAVKAYQSALAIIQDRNLFLDDPYSPTLEELPHEESRLYERLARACMKAEQFDAAFDALKKAHVLHPQGNDRLELNLAEVYLAAKKPEAAIIHLEKAVEHFPGADEAYRMLVTAYEQAGRVEETVPMLQKLHIASPQHSAINLVLAEQLVEQKQYAQAERLYREIFTVEQAAFKEATLGYFHLLARQSKPQEVLIELDQMLSTPSRAPWARAAVYALLADTELFKQVTSQIKNVNIKAVTRLTLSKLCIQAELWSHAESLLREQLKSELKPQELYLLLAKAHLEQGDNAALVELCKTAISHPGVSQPLVFHLELAKAHARMKNATACECALQSARELCGPDTTDDHKVLCTTLYTQHILKQHNACINLGNDALKTRLAQGPWARQVRYVLAHALEAVGKFDDAVKQWDIILTNDPNDGEALAALSRCLLFQSRDLPRAESSIRMAMELDLIDQRQRLRLGIQQNKMESQPTHLATLGTILIRQGKAQEGVAVLMDLAKRQFKQDPWISLALGDGYLVSRQNDLARQYWNQALSCLAVTPTMGTDLEASLQTRLKQVPANIVPASGSTTSSPGKP